MGMVTIEESDDEKSIVTPGLRLRFRWVGDRWTHAIDLGPGPELDDGWPWSINPKMGQWITIAEAIEWKFSPDEPGKVSSPVFQDLQFHQDENATYALLVGQAGPHHFSASFRVWDEFEARENRIDISNGLEGYFPSIDIDIADRCALPLVELASTYQIHAPFRCYPIGDMGDAAGCLPLPHMLWESVLFAKGRHDFGFGCHPPGDPSARLVITGDDGPWHAKLISGLAPVKRTQRYTYSWYHDCSTPYFFEEWRKRDPERDAYMRKLESKCEQREAEEREARKSPEVKAWAQRMGLDLDSVP